ncbi:hypothetical protein QFC20_003588 [Naganishia adeliensis]|uniref:Uncharacterized protein n=1 Tax=Naganishia adeliensis TaxID=92952 RepID=A0ACC2W9Y0_9TREE|nr:hypothetical protein QFC20_003588 [Naganishia adeliensis]
MAGNFRVGVESIRRSLTEIDSSIPVSLNTLDPEKPDHALLKYFGSLFIVVTSTRNVVFPLELAAENLIGYQTHARQAGEILESNSEQVAAAKLVRDFFANQIWEEVGALRQKVERLKPGDESADESEAKRWLGLVEGLARVFATNYCRPHLSAVSLSACACLENNVRQDPLP